MYQIRSITGLIFLAWIMLTAPLAHSSVDTLTRVHTGNITKTTSALSNYKNIDIETLDWRHPATHLTFDLPPNKWINDLELSLSVTPEGPVRQDTKLIMSLNGAKPVIIPTQGKGLTAKINLKSSSIRARNNRLDIFIPAPQGQTCHSAGNGAWHIDLKRSHLYIEARKRSRDFHIGEVETHLKSIVTGPHNIKITARGHDAHKYEVLAAQAIAKRTQNTPRFHLSGQNHDMHIYIGTQADLSTLLPKTELSDKVGPYMRMRPSHNTEIIISGETTEQVNEMVKAFATYHLPQARRNQINLGDMILQPRFSHTSNRLSDTHYLHDIGSTYFENNWRPTPRHINFDVEGSSATQGHVLLRVNSGKETHASSRISVELNDKFLGYTELDKSRKSVAFDFPIGSLKPTQNILKITPELNPKQDTECAGTQIGPVVSLGRGSRLVMEQTVFLPDSDLGHLLTTQNAFSQDEGQNTRIILPHQDQKRRAEAVTFLAHLAKTSGGSWALSDIETENNFSPNGKHILAVGVHSDTLKKLAHNAPRALLDIIGVRKPDLLPDLLITQTAPVKVASANTLAAFAQAANSATSQTAYYNTHKGIAALYPTTSARGSYLTGIFSASQPHLVRTSLSRLIDPEIWNNISGSVSVWNHDEAVMLQTASDITSPIASTYITSKNNAPLQSWKTMVSTNLEAKWFGFLLKTGQIRDSLTTGTHNLIGNMSAKFEPKPIAATKGFTAKPAAQTRPIPETNITPKLRGTIDPLTAPLTTHAKVSGLSFNVHDKLTAIKEKSDNAFTATRTWISDIAITERLHTFKQSARPFRIKVTNGWRKFMANQTWLERTNMSPTALLMIFIMVIMIILTGITSPIMRTGRHH